MAALNRIYRYENPNERKVLRSVSETVDFTYNLKNIVPKMLTLMHKFRGIGLAAPQVGIPLRFFVIEMPQSSHLLFVNPNIVHSSCELSIRVEGCLSMPNLYARIKRPSVIKIQACNASHELFTLEADGLLATVIQHELDHLNGILFTDHLSKTKSFKLLKHYMNNHEEDDNH